MQVTLPAVSTVVPLAPMPPALTSAAAPSRECETHPTSNAVASDSSVSFLFKAVFTTFARMTQSSSDGSADTDVRLMAKQKVQIELEVDGDFSLQVDIESKVKVRGLSGEEAVKAASELIDAMKTFTASLFTALQALFAPQSTPVVGAPVSATNPLAAAAPSPAAAASAATPVATPPVVSAATASTAAADTTPAAPVDAANPAQPAPPSVGSVLSRLRLQAAYVTAEFRMKLLIDDVARHERGDHRSLRAERRDRVEALKSDYDKVASALGQGPAGSGAMPSLADFLRAMSERDNRTTTALAFSLRASGSFVSVQA